MNYQDIYTIYNCGIDKTDKVYHVNGILHREDGPALITAKGSKHWFINGFRHREDGPASEYCNSDFKSWFLNNIEIDCKNNEEFLRIVKLKAFW